MAVAVACPACGSRFRVPEASLGKRGRCPRCQEVFRAEASPEPVAVAPVESAIKGVANAGEAASTQPPSETPPANASHAAAKPPAKKPLAKKRAAKPSLTLKRLRAGFVGPIDPVRTPLTYHLGILVATGMMLLVPLIYLTLIAAFGYSVYYHAVNHTGILTAARGRGAVVAALIYAAPLVIGPILLLFMLKPFFSRPVGGGRSRSLVRENEPLLFEFVDLICEAVGSPRPRRIDVDCQVNASAGFRRGFGSFLGGDLVLTIGMPLVAGLSLREFGGVLAHEFGHFTQGIGMRLTYVLRSLAAWLSRVVFDRDRWDQWLASSAAQADFRIGWVLYLAMLMVWITRQVLRALLNLSMAVVGYVLRQMEYDADRYETRVAGAHAFESTAKKLARLNAATNSASSQLAGAQLEGKLVDDLPGLIVLNLSRLPKSVDKELERQLENHRTGWFDSHPTDRDRIANARADGSEGVLTLPGPASQLFGNFEAHCQAATWEYYSQVFPKPVDRASLQPVRELHAKQNEQEKSREGLERYSQGTLRPRRRVGLRRDQLAPPESPAAEAERTRELRKRFEASIAAHREALRKWEKAADRALAARIYEEMHRADVSLPKKDLKESYRTREGCVAARKRARRSINEVERELEGVEAVAGERMLSALRLAQHDAIVSRMPDGDKVRTRIVVLTKALGAIEGSLETINSLRDQSAVLNALASVADAGGVSEELHDRVRMNARDAHGWLETLRDVLAVHDYPFDHADGEAKLGARVVPSVPDREALGDVISATDLALDAITTVHHQVLAELCAVAARIETALKLPPMPDPTEEGADAG